jgi:hypothetical protein
VARRRAQWKAYQGRIDPSRLVFIDGEAEKKSWMDPRFPAERDQDQYGPAQGVGAAR